MDRPISGAAEREPLSSTQMLLTVLVLVFLVEYAVMFLLLPEVLPTGASDSAEALLDSTLLTLGLAPLLWFVIVRPLRQTAVGERARAASVITTAADGILTMDRQTRIRSINPAMERILGWPAAELAGQPVSRLFDEAFRQRCTELLNVASVTGHGGSSAGTVPEIETAGRSRDGEAVPLTVSLSSFAIGEQRFVTAIAHDLTQRRRAEAEIAARARQQTAVAELGQRALAGIPLHELLNEIASRVHGTLDIDGCLILERDSPGTLLVCACAGRVVEPVCDEQYVLTPEDHAIWLPSELTSFDLASSELAGNELGSDLRAAGLSGVTSVLIERPGGEFGALLACRVHGTPPGRDARDFLQSVSNVIGSALQRERAERELREKEAIRAEQMSLLAQVATGVAHEIRNPLTSVKLICQTLREELDGDSGAARDCDIMIDEIFRMEQSLNVFLDYARPPRAKSEMVRIDELFERTGTLLERRCRNQQVTLEFVPLSEPLSVLGDAGQLQQLLLNLGLNALAVMPDGGRLSFSAQRNGGLIELTVSDTGPGVPAELQDRIFEPFFTTRETGVGLGLVICQRIANEHHGSLQLRPQETGASFALSLPVPHEQ
ncbi:PAS domain S-box protein [bacterium]|nr:PAS domain S-box protein [bacterium]